MRRILIAGLLVLSVGFGIVSSANAQSVPGTEGLWAQLRALQAQLQVLMEQARLQQISVPVPSASNVQVTSVPVSSVSSGYITLDEVQGSPRVSCALPAVKPRSSGPVVSLLQLILKQEGSYPEGFVTGYYGRLTQAAVERFQSARGLDKAGFVSADTARVLTELAGKLYSEECGSAPTPEPASITILSPNGGETYRPGQQITVRWRSHNAIAPISIMLIKHNPSVPYTRSEEFGDYSGRYSS